MAKNVMNEFYFTCFIKLEGSSLSKFINSFSIPPIITCSRTVLLQLFLLTQSLIVLHFLYFLSAFLVIFLVQWTLDVDMDMSLWAILNNESPKILGISLDHNVKKV